MTEIGSQIEAIRRTLGSDLCILGHHYQRASVLQHVDETGDSLELSRKAAQRKSARRIVFCGVRFMAESADILTDASQQVYMPDPMAGCPMASMADAASAERAWTYLSGQGGDWVPVVYVNSTAEVKAWCGRHGGSTCTSSNAARVLQWAFSLGRRVLFLPDEHLGVNTAFDLGLTEEQLAVFDPRQPSGGLAGRDLAGVRMVVWKGFCLVHTAFTVEQVRRVRELLPNARIIVHPETPREVLRLADAHGSTSQILRYVEQAPDGSTVVVGTEVNLVERLAELHRGRVSVKALAPSVCANMAKTNERNLLDLLQKWPEAQHVQVPDVLVSDARKALNMMLSL